MSNENTNWLNKKELIDKPFTITDTNPSEKYSVWDNNNKTFLKEGDTITFSNGTTAEVKRGMKFPEADSKNFNVSVQHNYDVEYNGSKYCVGFNLSIHRQFKKINDILKAVGKSLLDVELVINKEDKKPNTNFVKYDVLVYGKGSAPKHPANGFNPKVPEETIEDSPGGNNLLDPGNAIFKPSTDEQNIINKLRTIGEVNKQDFIATMKTNVDIDDSRAEQLWSVFNNSK